MLFRSSPFTSSNFTIHLEPDVRANMTATSVSKALKSSNDSDQTLYNGTDLSGTDRAVITVQNTSVNGNNYSYAWGDGDTDNNITSGAGDLSSNITHSYNGESAGSYNIVLTTTGTPDISAQSDTETIAVTLENVPAAPTSVSGKSLTLSTKALFLTSIIILTTYSRSLRLISEPMNSFLVLARTIRSDFFI